LCFREFFFWTDLLALPTLYPFPNFSLFLIFCSPPGPHNRAHRPLLPFWAFFPWFLFLTIRVFLKTRPAQGFFPALVRWAWTSCSLQPYCRLSLPTVGTHLFLCAQLYLFFPLGCFPPPPPLFVVFLMTNLLGYPTKDPVSPPCFWGVHELHFPRFKFFPYFVSSPPPFFFCPQPGGGGLLSETRI